MKKTLPALMIAAFVAGGVAQAQTVGLEQYLGQVQENNGTVQGALQAGRGAQEREVEGSLLFAPRLFSEALRLDDKRETTMPASQGDETELNQFKVGLSQVTRQGTAARVYYGVNDTSVSGVNPSYIQRPSYTDASVNIELSQPLWQNRGGRQYRNMELASAAQARATVFSKRYEAQVVLMSAELRYWNLAATREGIKILEENLVQTRGILAFNRRKEQRGLADKSDVLQAEAMVQSRNLDLARARGDEREAAREFNAFRNIDADAVDAELPFPSQEEVMRQLDALPQRAGMRNDLRAVEQGVQAQAAAGEINSDKTLPDLSAFATASLNARGDHPFDASQDTFNADHPYYTIGLKLSLPLDTPKTASVRKGYAQETAGAQAQYQQKKRDQDMAWKVLVNSVADIRGRLQAAQDLEKAQLVKLDEERRRQREGRSTMFQVFAFQQEYLAAQLNLVNLRANALALLAQAKLYSDPGMR